MMLGHEASDRAVCHGPAQYCSQGPGMPCSSDQSRLKDETGVRKVRGEKKLDVIVGLLWFKGESRIT